MIITAELIKNDSKLRNFIIYHYYMSINSHPGIGETTLDASVIPLNR